MQYNMLRLGGLIGGIGILLTGCQLLSEVPQTQLETTNVNNVNIQRPVQNQNTVPQNTNQAPTPNTNNQSEQPQPTQTSTDPLGSRLHESCKTTSCNAGLECVGYYGIAGRQGPYFQTCEIRCTHNSQCPSGTYCTFVADGPGQVCY